MTPNQLSLKDRVAVVTGATSGIGTAIALSLVEQGCRVVAAGRNQERLAEIVEQLGSSARPLCFDLADNSAISNIGDRLPDDWDAPTILVNNAGQDVGGRTRFDESTADELARVIDINLSAVIRLTRALVPAMTEKGIGDIVNIGSTQGLRPTPNLAAYSASKAGLHALSDVLRADYSKSGIRVIEIVPGLTKTEFAKTRWRGDEQKAKEFFEKFPSTLAPEDVADTVRFALTRARHINTSQIIVTPSWQW